MNKIAQNRNWIDKVREKINEPGEHIVSKFTPEWSIIMDTLREVDNDVREIATSLKGALKTVKSSLNRREYMEAISYLGKFHGELDRIKETFGKLNTEVSNIHNEFLFGDLDPEHKNYLFNMQERYKPKSKQKPVVQKADDGNLEKEAGLKEMWKDLTGDENLATDRAKALKIWEKRFPKASKDIKRQTERMLNRSEVFLNFLLGTLKQLATYRATRKVEDYLRLVSNFISKYESYDDSFNEFFNSSVRKYLDAQKEYDARKEKFEVNKDTINTNTSPVGSNGEGSIDAGSTGIKSEETTENKTNPLDDIEKEIKDKINEMDENQKENEPKPFPKPNIQSDITEPINEETIDSPITPPSSNKVEQPIVVAPSAQQNIVPIQTKPEPVIIPTPPIPGPQPTTTRMPPVPPIPVVKNPSGPINFKTYPKDIKTTPIKADEFINQITKLSNANPLVLATEIIKFAKSIDDKNTATQLIAIAKGLIK